jgi:hypothetical protein
MRAWSRIQEVIRDRQIFRVSTLTPAIYAGVYYDLEQRGIMIPIKRYLDRCLGD